MTNTTIPRYSVVVPVYNEEAVLTKTAHALKRATILHDVEIAYVLNGTNDKSAQVIASVFGDSAAILKLEIASKTEALNAGDDHCSQFPRFYLDADICIDENALATLEAELSKPSLELIAAPILPNSEGGTWAAKEVARIWGALPYLHDAAFQCCIGVSEAGRARWDRWPKIIADDLFISSQIPEQAKLICPETSTIMPTPKNLRSWIGVRTRWIQGQNEFKSLQLGEISVSKNQRVSLIYLLKTVANWPGVALYLFVWIAALMKSKLAANTVWYRDETVRSKDA